MGGRQDGAFSIFSTFPVRRQKPFKVKGSELGRRHRTPEGEHDSGVTEKGFEYKPRPYPEMRKGSQSPGEKQSPLPGKMAKNDERTGKSWYGYWLSRVKQQYLGRPGQRWTGGSWGMASGYRQVSLRGGRLAARVGGTMLRKTQARKRDLRRLCQLNCSSSISVTEKHCAHTKS